MYICNNIVIYFGAYHSDKTLLKVTTLFNNSRRDEKPLCFIYLFREEESQLFSK